MPIYEYECENKHRFEKWQSMKDDPIKECPECGTPVHKILHPAGIIFKGSGWYVTDSRKPAGEAKADTKPEAKSDGGDGKAESKTESKSEGKGESKSPPSESSSGSGASKSGGESKTSAKSD
jgi:putative FmdB family regulatory protein